MPAVLLGIVTAAPHQSHPDSPESQETLCGPRQWGVGVRRKHGVVINTRLGAKRIGFKLLLDFSQLF